MYATAQRVRSPERTTGINIFVYDHGDQPVPRRGGSFDVQRVTTEEPGQLVAEQREIDPGGNEVLSYIDVVASDGTDLAMIQNALDGLEGKLPARLPSLHENAQVSVFFGGSLGLSAAMRDEFGELRARLMAVLSQIAVPTPKAIEILVEEGADTITYGLTPTSVAAISAVRPDIRTTPSISVRKSADSDFLTLQGDLRRQLALLLTRLEEIELIRVGGVRFIDEAGELVGRWPGTDFFPQIGEAPIYAVRSGRYLGWRSDRRFFGPQGDHLGYFDGRLLRGLDGRFLAEAYPSHTSHYGVRPGRPQPLAGAPMTPESQRRFPSRTDKAGIDDAGWNDPDLTQR